MLYFHKSREKLCDTWIILILFILQGQSPGDQINEGKSKLKGSVIEVWRCLEVAKAAGLGGRSSTRRDKRKYHSSLRGVHETR